MASCDVMYSGAPFHGIAPPRETPPPAYRPPYNQVTLPPYRSPLGSSQSPPGSAHSVQSGHSSYTCDVRYVFDYESSAGSMESRSTNRSHGSRSQDNQQSQPVRQQSHPDPNELYAPPASVRRAQQKSRTLPTIRGAQTPPSPPPRTVPALSVYKPGPPKPPRYNTAVSRRRTWSPPTFDKAIGAAAGASLSHTRAFRSNDQLDAVSGDHQEENIYEDPDVSGTQSVTSPPPNIAPISGKLSESSSDELIRPIAFKPLSVGPLPSRYVPTPARNTHCTRLLSVTSPDEYHTTTTTSGDSRRTMKLMGQQSQDDGYVSQDYHGSHNYSTSGSDLTGYMDTSPSRYTTVQGHMMSPDSSYVKQTPSPSDSGVGEMEAMLQNKNAEIQHLRGVMERNETAIFQVFEEKRQNWEVELHDVATEWENRLKQQQQQAFRKEQSHLLTIHQVQQEKDNMLVEQDAMKSEIASLTAQLGQQAKESERHLLEANNRIQEAKWESTRKVDELRDVRQCLSDTENRMFKMKQCMDDAESGIASRDREMQRLREQLDLSMSEAGGFRAEVDRLQRQAQHHKLMMVNSSQQTDSSRTDSEDSNHMDNTMDAGTETDVSSVNATAEVLEMHDQVDDIRNELVRYKQAFNDERTRWLEEKDKVIRYQKHLQLNYEQMRKKNLRLETDINQLMAELETRDSPSTTSSQCSSTPPNMCKVPPLPVAIPPLETTTSPLASSTLKRDLHVHKQSPANGTNGPMKAVHSLLPPSGSNSLSKSAFSGIPDSSKVTVVTKVLPATTC